MAAEKADRPRSESTGGGAGGLKFRHVKITPAMKANNVSITTPRNGNWASDGATANSLFFAAPWSGAGGTFVALPWAKAQGKRYEARGMAFAQAHTQPLVDLTFDPFDDYVLYTAGGDDLVRVWRLGPDGVSNSIDFNSPDAAQGSCYTGMQMEAGGKISAITCNPAVKGCMALTTPSRLRVMDVEIGREFSSRDCEADGGVHSMCWTPTGASCLLSLKNRTIITHDPRAPTLAASVFPGHSTVSPNRLAYLKGNHFCSTGKGAGGTREILWYDTRNSSSPSGSYTVDTGSGTLLPLFDADTGIMVMPSKGDGSVRLLEWCNDALVQVQMETLADPHIGFAMLPKRTLNVKAVELLRFARITPDFVHTVSVAASRARMDLFQDDLYPPCLSGQPCASMQEYASGGGLPELPRVSLQPQGMQLLSEIAPIRGRSTSGSGSSGVVVGRNIRSASLMEATQARIAAMAANDSDSDEKKEESDEDW